MGLRIDGHDRCAAKSLVARPPRGAGLIYGGVVRSRVPHLSASYSITIRLEIVNKPGMLGTIATRIGEAGGSIGAIDTVRVEQNGKLLIRDITVSTENEAHERVIRDALQGINGVNVRAVSDRTFLMHLGGKIEVRSKLPLKTRDDLSIAYTPGVARICRAIAADPETSHNLTIRKNMVAVVSDGSAILGLGNLGPLAALPVMEGKAQLFKEFAGVDAFPICIDVHTADEIVALVKAIAPTFGGINLEDIAAPTCFEVEERLKREVDIPVFHDDQHGTAVVMLAGLLNALKVVGKRIEDCKIVVSGVGASGTACTKIMLAAGARNITGCDSKGTVHEGRADLNSAKKEYARLTNPAGHTGTLKQALAGADVFVGLSGPNLLVRADIETMAAKPIVFAMANPDPEITPEEAGDRVAVMATGRSDYPNQINNVLCFPGIFKGALDAGATDINEAMKLAAAEAIAGLVAPEELSAEYIVPSVFHPRVGKVVARAVAKAARASGVCRRRAAAGAELR
jgi:malate dehydrogenase (oxaloacetate-decarboxylating)